MDNQTANQQTAQSKKDWNRQQNFTTSFSRTASQIPLDRLIKQHTFEIIEVLLMMTHDNFKMSRTPITNQLQQALNLVKERTDAKKVQEIRR